MLGEVRKVEGLDPRRVSPGLRRRCRVAVRVLADSAIAEEDRPLALRVRGTFAPPEAASWTNALPTRR